MNTEPNSYSPAWFAHFHEGIPESRTEQELAYVTRHCPVSSFPRVLDVCCGMGRHARGLAEKGYSVTGFERDAGALAIAREKGGGPLYLAGDIRDYQPPAESFDAVIVLSQSFGYFDPETNLGILRRLGTALREGGHLILDLWNLEFFHTRQGEHRFQLAIGEVVEAKSVVGDRLITRLSYPGGGSDAFEFQTFSPEQMALFARSAGLDLIETCSDFSSTVRPCAEKPKVQHLLRRRPSKLNEVIQFVSENIGCDPSRLTPDTRLFEDLGIDGDDAEDLMRDFASHFTVDLTGYEHLQHFGPEAGWSPIAIHPSGLSVPITLVCLAEAAAAGRWLSGTS